MSDETLGCNSIGASWYEIPCDDDGKQGALDWGADCPDWLGWLGCWDDGLSTNTFCSIGLTTRTIMGLTWTGLGKYVLVYSLVTFLPAWLRTTGDGWITNGGWLMMSRVGGWLMYIEPGWWTKVSPATCSTSVFVSTLHGVSDCGNVSNGLSSTVCSAKFCPTCESDDEMLLQPDDGIETPYAEDPIDEVDELGATGATKFPLWPFCENAQLSGFESEAASTGLFATTTMGCPLFWTYCCGNGGGDGDPHWGIGDAKDTLCSTKEMQKEIYSILIKHHKCNE